MNREGVKGEEFRERAAKRDYDYFAGDDLELFGDRVNVESEEFKDWFKPRSIERWPGGTERGSRGETRYSVGYERDEQEVEVLEIIKAATSEMDSINIGPDYSGSVHLRWRSPYTADRLAAKLEKTAETPADATIKAGLSPYVIRTGVILEVVADWSSDVDEVDAQAVAEEKDKKAEQFQAQIEELGVPCVVNPGGSTRYAAGQHGADGRPVKSSPPLKRIERRDV